MVVVLHPSQTRVEISPAIIGMAVSSAYRVTLSPHEHAWTSEESAAMAQYVLWAMQRLDVIEQLVKGDLKQ